MFLFMCSLLLEENCKLVSFTRDFFTRFDKEKQSIVKIFT